MKKMYRINTTISLKHHDLLIKYAEKFGTQQSVLEHALESLENNLNQSALLSPEEKQWMHNYREIRDIITILPKNLTKLLFKTADIEQFSKYIENVKEGEAALEYYYNKPLKEFSLQEIIEGIFFTIKLQGSSDTLNYTDDGDQYKINMTHNLGIFSSKALVLMYGSVFNSYGVKFESNFSERSIYFKVFKNELK